MTPTATDTLIAFGSEVKALPDGKVGGYLVLFGGPDQTDLTKNRDYFTKDTDFGLDQNTKSVALYDHCMNPDVKGASLGQVEMKMDDVGVWVEGQVAAREAYEAKVKQIINQGIPELIAAKKLGWSSGTAAHRVERVQQPNGSHFIKTWPLGLDASLTPSPAEWRTQAVSVKSLGSFVAERATKGAALGDHVERNVAMHAVDRLGHHLQMGLYDALADDKTNPAEKMLACKGMFDEHQATGMKMIGALMTPSGDGAEDDDSDVAIKSLFNASIARLHAGLTMDAHSETVRAAVKGFTDRLTDIAAKRAESGRSLSASRLAEIRELKGLLDALLLAATPVDTKAIEDRRILDSAAETLDRLRFLDLDL